MSSEFFVGFLKVEMSYMFLSKSKSITSESLSKTLFGCGNRLTCTSVLSFWIFLMSLLKNMKFLKLWCNFFDYAYLTISSCYFDLGSSWSNYLILRSVFVSLTLFYLGLMINSSGSFILFSSLKAREIMLLNEIISYLITSGAYVFTL